MNINATRTVTKGTIKMLPALGPSVNEGVILRVYDLEFNLSTYTVKREGIKLKFQSRQLKLLQYMMYNSGRILSEDELITHVWADNQDLLKSNVLKACISKLRKQVDGQFDKKLIHTRHSMGYILTDEE